MDMMRIRWTKLDNGHQAMWTKEKLDREEIRKDGQDGQDGQDGCNNILNKKKDDMDKVNNVMEIRGRVGN